ncbi:hypothetical protein [Limosilactobacillus mucosae]|uniref:hypothetical protein n=1 Tax=Limosilactobacillus mucosae TaxID=97478 RepID=UPI000FFC17A0|nr:hypothetical protein [Limosilactobacillus mucosae]RXA55768.1 hypothetical protein EQ839_08425 [Limosilactobacillus mucosae]
MIKTKMFTDYDNDNVDKQINTWLSKHQDYIVRDVKLSTNLLHDDFLICTALVIYREYENV